MWSNLGIILIPVLLVLVVVGCIFLIVFFWRRKQDKFYRESPLTKNLMRPPGYSLQLQLNKIDEDLSFYLTLMLAIPLLLYSFHLSESYLGQKPESFGRFALSITLSVIVISFLGVRLKRLLDEKKNMVLGLQGEMFTGEELNQLMLHGCRIFHDIQFQYGNIDHVVVSQSGVYSVNTKMRGKPRNGIARAELIIDYQQNLLCFPDGEFQIPIKQLATEATWLAQYLTSAVGRPIKVKPILAYPGWYIKQRIGKGPVCVINPQNSKKFFVHNHEVLSPAEIQQVAHQLEQLCRNVEPVFRDKKRWKN